MVGFLGEACQLTPVYYCLSRKAGHAARVCYCRVSQEGWPAHPALLLLRAHGGPARKLPAKWGDGNGATPDESHGCHTAIRDSHGWDPAPQLHPAKTGRALTATNTHSSPGGCEAGRGAGSTAWCQQQGHGRSSPRTPWKAKPGGGEGDPGGPCTQRGPELGTQGISCDSRARRGSSLGLSQVRLGALGGIWARSGPG